MNPEPQSRSKAHPLVMGLVFGIVFGFLLQKGGVGKYHVLIGQLLLRDWTVLKIMGTAVLLGMVSIYAMHAAGMVKLHIKRTRLGANVIGGLIFGVGFALSAYCPGTNLAALGQGNWDGWFVAAGLLAGSYLFAEASGFLAATVEKWGDRGKLTLDQWLHLPRKVFLPGFAVVLGVGLILLEKFSSR